MTDTTHTAPATPASPGAAGSPGIVLSYLTEGDRNEALKNARDLVAFLHVLELPQFSPRGETANDAVGNGTAVKAPPAVRAAYENAKNAEGFMHRLLDQWSRGHVQQPMGNGARTQ